MGCNCKKKKEVDEPQPVDKLVGFQLINKAVINNEHINSYERDTLYRFYNEQFDERVMVTCVYCWEGFVKEKLRELWIRESLERAQS
jgi:hypothetical protein